MNSTAQKLLMVGLLAVLFVIFQFSPFMKTLDLKSLDLFRTSHPPHPSVVVLAIDNKSIDSLGRWPWSRTVHSQIIDKLHEAQPQLVAIDVTFSEPENEAADKALSKSLHDAGFKVVLAAQAVSLKGEVTPQKVLLPLPAFLENDNVSPGIVNVPLSEDGIARSFPESVTYQGQNYLPFTYQAAKLLNSPVPDDKEKFVNFAGPAGTFATYSISDVVNSKVGKEQLQGQVIFIGATASDLHDTLLTPTRPEVMAGVEYHANVLDNVLLKRPINVLPQSYELAIGLALLVIFLLMLIKLSAKVTIAVAAAAIILLPLVSFVLWRQEIALSYVHNTIFAAGFVALYGLYSWYTAEREKRRIRETFQNYFSPSVMQAILKDPEALKLGGKRANITIFFSDIRGFTTISESLPPEKLTALLQEYFTEMTDEILATDGVVDKFIGDAIMAFWGAPIEQPDQADRAVQAATNMIKKLKRLQTKWKREGYPHVDIGIGLHSGEVTVGNMGSEKRFDYTVIGDAVNIASRLEGLNKEYKTNIIISEATKKQLKKSWKLKSLGSVLVKGKTKPVQIYTISLDSEK